MADAETPVGILVGSTAKLARAKGTTAPVVSGLRLFPFGSILEARTRYQGTAVALVLVEEKQPKPGLVGVIEDAEDAFPESGIVVVSRAPRFSEFLRAHLVGADLYVGRAAIAGVLDQWSALQQQRQTGRNLLFDDIRLAVYELSAESSNEGQPTTVDSGTIDQVAEDVMRGMRPARGASSVEHVSPESLQTALKSALTSSGLPDDARDSATTLVRRRMMDRYRGNFSLAFEPEVQRPPSEPAGRVPPRPRPVETVTGGGGPDPAPRNYAAKRDPTPTHQPADLFWNTRFSEDAGILRNEPHGVVAGGEYPFETVLEVVARAGSESSPIAATAVVNRSVAFALRCRNGALRLDDSSPWVPSIESAKLRCRKSGTPPFRVIYRAGSAGTAEINLALLVRNGTVATQHIHLNVSGSGKARSTSVIATPSQARSVSRLGANVGSAIAHASATRLRLELDDAYRHAKLSVDGVNLSGFAVTPKLEGLGAGYAACLINLEPLSSSQGSFPDEGFALTNPEVVRLAFAKAGARLHELLFLAPMNDDPDPIMRSYAAEIGRRGGRGAPPLLEISAPDFPIPWGLLYDRSKNGGLDLATADDVDPLGFWGHRFDIQRMVTGIPTEEPMRGTRRWLKPVVAKAAPGGTASADFMNHLRGKSNDSSLKIRATSTSGDAFLKWSAKDLDVDLIYLFCHANPTSTIDSSGGVSTVADPRESALGFGGTGRTGVQIRVTDLKGKWPKPRRTNPIVFLNACSSGRLDVVYGSPFVRLFVDTWEAQTFLGTDWAVPGVFAERFGTRILRALLEEGASIREAVRCAADESFAIGDDFPLLYGIYGPSNVRFVKEPK